MRKIRLKPTESYCQKYLYTKIMTSKCKIIKYKLNANIFFQIYFCSTFSVRIQKVKINWKGRRLFERRHSKNTIWCESTNISTRLEIVPVLSHQMGVFQWVWFKKSEHHSIMWEDFNRHRKKSNKILFEWWYFLSIFICIFYIGLSLFCEKILKCHFFLFFPAIFSPVSFNLLNGIQKKYYFYIHWNISIYKFKCVSIKYKI